MSKNKVQRDEYLDGSIKVTVTRTESKPTLYNGVDIEAKHAALKLTDEEVFKLEDFMHGGVFMELGDNKTDEKFLTILKDGHWTNPLSGRDWDFYANLFEHPAYSEKFVIVWNDIDARS